MGGRDSLTLEETSVFCLNLSGTMSIPHSSTTTALLPHTIGDAFILLGYSIKCSGADKMLNFSYLDDRLSLIQLMSTTLKEFHCFNTIFFSTLNLFKLYSTDSLISTTE